jgi:hypothetical protein
MKVYEVPAIIAARAGVAVVPVRLDYRRGLRALVRIRLHAAARIMQCTQATPRARRIQATEELRRLMETAAFAERARVSVFEAFLDAVREHGRRTLIIEDLKRASAFVSGSAERRARARPA